MTLDYAQMAMAIAIGEAVVLFALVQLGFRIIKHYIRRIASLEANIQSKDEQHSRILEQMVSQHQSEIDKMQDRHDRLVHYRDRTIIEDTMVALERESKSTNFKHEQEMMSAFHTLRSLFDKYTTLLDKYIGFDISRTKLPDRCESNKQNPQDVEMF